MVTLDKETYIKFLNLSSALSPENLHCDGEISRTEANRKYKSLMREWSNLEKKIGFKVSEDDVWRHYRIYTVR